MRKLLFFTVSILLSITQNNASYDLFKDKVYYQNLHLKQEMIVLNEKNPLPITFDRTEPVIVSLETGNFDEIMENFNQNIEQHIVPQLKTTWQLTIGSLLNAENAFRFGLPIALCGAIAISGFFGARIGWKILEKRLLSPKPTILQPGSKYGWLDRWKLSRANYTIPSMIFDETVKKQLEEIQEKTKTIRHQISCGKKITYDNLLLYGKPGTGKTLFAHILADITDMDFLSITAASLLQSGIEGIRYFDEIIEMAANSKYGVILFIDEADALFINRDMLNPESDHYKLLNHVLAATGNGSNKMMLIAATNYAHIMDPAMGRRFQDRIKMPLPNEQTRKELLNLYIDEYFLDEIDISYTSQQAARAIFTPAYIVTIVQQTFGLSHAEIKDMIALISKKSLATKDGILNIHHVQSSIDQAIEKVKALKRDKVKLKKKKNSLLPQQESFTN